MSGVLDYAPALATNLNVDDTGNTFAGVLNGKFKVYVDPYAANISASQYYVIDLRVNFTLRFWFILLPICCPTTNGESSWSKQFPTKKLDSKLDTEWYKILSQLQTETVL